MTISISISKTRTKTNQRGFSILEALIASMVMIVGIVGLMALFAVALVRNAGQGEQAMRCTEYAQDKMEQLMALQPYDTTSCVIGTTSLSSANSTVCSGTVSVGMRAGGNTTVATAGSGYADYVISSGTAETVQNSTTGGTLLYTRMWSIADSPSGCNQPLAPPSIATPPVCLKTVTVTVKSNFTGFSVGATNVTTALAPTTTLISVKQPNY